MPYETDGAVIKLNNIELRHQVGNTSKAPRWAMAYKFESEQAITRLKDITIQVGRTGVLTPVAELEPVLVAGSTISRATLHNEDDMKRKGVLKFVLIYVQKKKVKKRYLFTSTFGPVDPPGGRKFENFFFGISKYFLKGQIQKNNQGFYPFPKHALEHLQCYVKRKNAKNVISIFLFLSKQFQTY